MKNMNGQELPDLDDPRWDVFEDLDGKWRAMNPWTGACLGRDGKTPEEAKKDCRHYAYYENIPGRKEV